MRLARRHVLFLLGFEAAIWHFRGATTCFYWASKLPSGTFPAALQRLKTLPAALPWDLPRPLELFLLAFEAAIWPFTASTTFYRASKLPSGTFPAPLKSLKTFPAALPWDFPRPYELFLLGFEAPVWPSEAPQLSIGLRNCHLARFQHALKPCYIRCYPTFPLTRPSPRCVVLALDSPGLMRRPNKHWHRLGVHGCIYMHIHMHIHIQCDTFRHIPSHYIISYTLH